MNKSASRKRATLQLRLYVTGNAPNSTAALANLRAICDEKPSGHCSLEIIDLLREPLRSANDRVIVTPTLIRLAPAPPRRLIGNLSDTEQLLNLLGGR